MPWTGGPPAAFAEEAQDAQEAQEGKEGEEGKAGQEGQEDQAAQEGGAASAASSHAERGRAFFRPHVHRELSDALCTTDGAVGGVLDGRRFAKAVCCVPRHPDAPRADGENSTRAFGQPSAHRRMAGLLAESLPNSLKCWRVLTHISQESSRRESALGSRLRQIVAEGAAAVESAALPADGDGDGDGDGAGDGAGAWGLLLEQLRHLRLSAADEYAPNLQPATLRVQAAALRVQARSHSHAVGARACNPIAGGSCAALSSRAVAPRPSPSAPRRGGWLTLTQP